MSDEQHGGPVGPPQPQDESERLARLLRLEVLDTPPEVELDRITRVVSRLFDVPIALISLVDEHRQWFKSRWGLEAEQTPREYAFCAYAILGSEVMVVPDAGQDPRFADNPLVTGAPHIRFYAGAPLLTEGHAIGTLCAIDRRPRALSESDRVVLADLAATVVELLERRARLLQLGRTARLHRQILDASPAGLLVADRDGRIQLANASLERLLGYERGGLLGRAVDELVPEAQREGHAALRARYAEDPRAREMGAGRSLSARRQDGTNLPVEIGLSPVETESGPAVIASLLDVTQFREAEAELRRSNSDLEQFAYVVSHDLREPIRMVRSFTELVREALSGELDETVQLHLGFVHEGATRMDSMVTDILAYSRAGREARTLGAADLNRMLEVLEVDLRSALSECDGVLEVAAELPSVRGDEIQLRRVLQNLIGNAIKYRGDRQPRIRVSARTAGSFIQVEVEDNGIGVDPRFADRIFMPFQRLHGRAEYEGSGIGLAICKKIVESHGGAIGLGEPPDGGGARFFFTVPPALRNGG